MDSLSIWHWLIVLAILFVLYVLPLLLVLISSRANGGAKFGWFIVAFFFSWLGYAVFLIVTQPKPPARSTTSTKIEPTI